MKCILSFLLLSLCISCIHARTFGLFVGVGCYAHDGGDAIPSNSFDAKALADFYSESHPDGIFLTMIDNEATAERVKGAMRCLFANSTVDDDIVLFFSTHGSPSDLMMYDADIMKTEIQDILSKCKARKKVIIVNACHSGTFTRHRTHTGQTDARYSSERLKKHASATYSDVVVLTSARSSQYSLGYLYNGPGPFVIALISALKGSADTDGDSIVSIREVYVYLRDWFGNSMYEQKPQMKGRFTPSSPFI